MRINAQDYLHSHPPARNDLCLSLETVIGTSSLFGHEMESHVAMRHRHDIALMHALEANTTVPLANARQQAMFAVAPLDVLVTEENGEKKFHIIEMNGTGIGGLTIMPESIVSSVCQSIGQIPEFVSKKNPLIIIGSSGKESETSPRLNKQIFEKVLYADSVYRKFLEMYGDGKVLAMDRVLANPGLIADNRPTVIVGYIKEFMRGLTCRDGRIYLGDRTVDGIVNDRMCLNILTEFD